MSFGVLVEQLVDWMWKLLVFHVDLKGMRQCDGLLAFIIPHVVLRVDIRCRAVVQIERASFRTGNS